MSAGGKQLAVYYHTHWDREWYLPFRAYQVRLAQVVDDILERLEAGVFSCFTLDGQTVVLEDYLELRPHHRERLQTLVEQQRVCIGPWYVMPDELLVGGESLIRNLQRGIREARAWGCHEFTGYLPDTFGHGADLPEIFRQFGIESAVVWRGVQPEKSLFRWQSPSGAEVLTLHLTEGYFQMILQDWTLNEAEKRQALETLTAKLEAVCPGIADPLMPVGGDHLGPVTEAGLAVFRGYRPDFRETTPERYLADFRKENKDIGDLPLIQGELTDNSGSFLLPGVYSSRMYLKQANRRLEHRMSKQLEPMLALSHRATGQRYPEAELDLAWKLLILNHPHDSICGCSVDAVHRENEVRFEQVAQLADAMMDRAEQALASVIGKSDDWVVFHTGDEPYTGVVPMVEDVRNEEETHLSQVERERTVLRDEYRYDTQRIPLAHLTQTRRTGWIWVENIPPFSVSAIPKSHAAVPSEVVSVTSNTLRNGLISVQVGVDDLLTVVDLKTGREIPGLLTFWDKPDQGDSYNSAPVPGLEPVQARFVSARIVAEGPLVGILELRHELLGMTLETRLRLDAGSPLLRFETRFVNRRENHKLQVAFNTGAPVTEVLAESHLGTVIRHYDPAYREVSHMPVPAWKELKTSTGPIQRFLSANGQSWITEGLCEYEVSNAEVSITLLRAFSHLSKADTGVRGAQAGPPFETPGGQCLNRTFICRYAWAPTPLEKQHLYRLADQFYGATWGRSGAAEAQPEVTSISLVQWDASELKAIACYWLPERGLILRLLNTSDVEVSTLLKADFPAAGCWAVNFLDELQYPLQDGLVVIPPHGVQTILFAVG